MKTGRLLRRQRTLQAYSASLQIIGSVIGHGASAIVHQATHRYSGDVVAIKCFGDGSAGEWKESVLMSLYKTCTLPSEPYIKLLVHYRVQEHVIQFHESNLSAGQGPQLVMEHARLGGNHP